MNRSGGRAMTGRLSRLIAVLLLALTVGGELRAHALQPGYLEVEAIKYRLALPVGEMQLSKFHPPKEFFLIATK